MRGEQILRGSYKIEERSRLVTIVGETLNNIAASAWAWVLRYIDNIAHREACEPRCFNLDQYI
jgi:hypothetical protein